MSNESHEIGDDHFDKDEDWSLLMPVVESEAAELSPPSITPTPTPDDDIQVVSALFAKQNIHETPSELLQSVSPVDRYKSYEDVHGVSEPIQETPELLASSLEALTRALNQSVSEASLLNCDDDDPDTRQQILLHQGYSLAALQAPAYVEEQLPKFLRAEGFDIDHAKVRALKFFNAKLRFFGPSALGRELCLKDFKEVELKVLREGGVQLLTEPDQRGRPILAQFSKVCMHYPVEIAAKLMFWSAMVASRHENNQRRGFIHIHYGVDVHGAYSEASTKRGLAISSMLACLPIRYAAIHICINDPSALTRTSLMTQVAPRRYLFRIQSHFGTHLECRYNLMTFGIPLSVMSVVQNDGSIDLTKHLAWLARMEDEETKRTGRPLSETSTPFDTTCSIAAAATEPTNSVAPPRDMDVIMGKGLRGISSKGNQLLKRLVEERLDEYNSVVRIKKAYIAGEIYTDMRRRGCRFLAPSKTGKNATSSIAATGSGSSAILVWEEVLEAEAVNRICHTFRNLRQSAAQCCSTESTNKA